jgi:hypothetical protein
MVQIDVVAFFAGLAAGFYLGVCTACWALKSDPEWTAKLVEALRKKAAEKKAR